MLQLTQGRRRQRAGAARGCSTQAAQRALGAAIVLCAGLSSSAGAQSSAVPYRVRSMLAGATMVSDDQVGRLGYDRFGLLTDVQLGFAVKPWLELNLGVLAGGFPSPHKLGGLVAPLGGVLVTGTDPELRPYALFDLGPGFSGRLMRVFWRAAVGVELQASNTLSIGPRLGYGQLFQTDDPGDSSDARFLWLGFALSFRPASVKQRLTERFVQRVIYTRQSLPAEPRERTEPAEPKADTGNDDLMELIERTLPSRRVELLAPVLFKFDSDVLEPLGVAMLHEVAHELSQRSDILLLEIQGYADSRGSAEYNQSLSARRATRVLEWLVAHEVARERLQVAAQGASAFVEPGQDEHAHEQNRRVVFRVLRMAEK